MIYREFDTGESIVPLTSKTVGGFAPTYTIQDLTPGPRSGLYLGSDLETWAAPATSLPMAQLPGTVMAWSGAVFQHQLRRASTGQERYLVTYVTSTDVTVEVWDFETQQVQRLRRLNQYLLAPRVEVSRPTARDVQRSFFDELVGGIEVLRFNSHQNPVGSAIEEVQTDTTSEI